MDGFEGHQYEGEPLSDRIVLAKAGMSVATEITSKVKEFLLYENHWSVYGREEFPRGVYARNLAKIRGFERDMNVVSVLGGEQAEEGLHRLWLLASRLAILEQIRISRAGEELVEEQNQQRGAQRGRRGRACSTGRIDRHHNR